MDNEVKLLALKCLTLFCYWVHGSLNISQTKDKVPEWGAGLKEFFEHYKVTKTGIKTLDKALTRLQEGKVAPDADASDLIEAVGRTLYDILPRLQKDESLNRIDLRNFAALSLFMRKTSMNAWQTISKAAGPLDDAFTEEQVVLTSQDHLVYDLVHLVMGFTGRRDVRLTEDERAQLKSEDPETYERFLRLRREILDQAKVAIRDFVRKSRNEAGTADYAAVRGFLTDYGILHDLPEEYRGKKDGKGRPLGFIGRIDEKLRFYTSGDLVLKQRPYFAVTMNPDYDPEADYSYYCTCITDMGHTQYFQTERVTKALREERFEVVKDFIPNLPKLRAKWTMDMRQKDGSRECIMAAIVELIYWSSARVGSVGNKTDGKETYGITTLLKEHVHKRGPQLIIDYRGKSGVQQKHVLTPKTPDEKVCASIVWGLAQEAAEGERIFHFNGDAINRYLKKLGSGAATIHKVRHARATSMMVERLKSCPFKVGKKADQKAAEDWYREAALDVGRELGHVSGEKITEMTAIKSYIASDLTVNYFRDRKLRLPSWAEKFEE